MKQMLMTGTAVILIGLASPVLARGHGPQMPDFASLDADGSGAVSLEELNSAHDAHLSKLDANGDGVVAVEELQAMMAERMPARAPDRVRQRLSDRAQKMLSRADADGDGKVTLAELRAAKGHQDHARMMSRLDQDGDGELSAQEFAALGDRKGGRRGDRHWGDRHWGGKDRHGRAHSGDHSCDRGAAESGLTPPPAVGQQPFPADVN